MRSMPFGLRKRTLPSAFLCILLTVPGAVAAENRPTNQREAAPVASPVPARNASPQPFTEQELVAMSAAQEEPGPEVTGGALSNQQLTYVAIALAAAVIVLIAK